VFGVGGGERVVVGCAGSGDGRVRAAAGAGGQARGLVGGGAAGGQAAGGAVLARGAEAQARAGARGRSTGGMAIAWRPREWTRSWTRRCRDGVGVAGRSVRSGSSGSIGTSCPSRGGCVGGLLCISASAVVAGGGIRGVTRFRLLMRWGRRRACWGRARSRWRLS